MIDVKLKPHLALLIIALSSSTNAICRRDDILDSIYCNLAEQFKPAKTACAVQVRNSKKQVIGTYSGVLVGSGWVLTAGHVGAAAKNKDTVIRFGSSAKDYSPPIKVKNWFFHPKWTGNFGTSVGADLALGQLEESIFGIEPIKIYERPHNSAQLKIGEFGYVGYFAGFGVPGNGVKGTTSGDQRKRVGISMIKRNAGTMNTIFTAFDNPNNIQFDLLKGLTHEISKLPNFNLTSGDSGGPLYIQQNGIGMLVGIASGTGRMDGKKADFKYGSYNQYTAVAFPETRKWILETVKKSG
jgi:hypothetical protein